MLARGARRQPGRRHRPLHPAAGQLRRAARRPTNSLDQLPLYDALTPLRGNVTRPTSTSLFLPENFKPIGATREEQTGRPGLTLIYDTYGIPHVYGKTRADVAFGAGWATARDRGLLVQLGRGPARVAVADVPGINAFWLVTSGQSFVPEPAAEALVTAQKDLLVKTYGDKGRQIIADAQAYADGVNAYWKANNIDQPPATVNDVIAVTAFIGSIFGAGGGGEASNSELLAKLQQGLGPVRGYKAWDDVMLADDPEAPTTIEALLQLPAAAPAAGRRARVVIDPGSIESVDPRQPLTAAAGTAGTASADDAIVDAAAAPPRRQASNFLVVSPDALGDATTRWRVMGPQLGYYYPEIVQQIHLHGPGIKAQGVAVPGLAMYILIGRTQDYAWSLTSANHDVRDVFAEQLCNPDGSAPTRASTHYLFKGSAGRSRTFNAGLLDGKPLRYQISVHGPVIGTATVGGQAVRAVAQALDVRARRPEPRRAEGHDRGQGVDARALLQGRQPVRLHVQLGVRLAQGHGVLLVRPPAEARPRARPPPAHARHRRVRVARLPERAPAPARRRAARAACC